MTINLKLPEAMNELKPRITVFGVGGAGGNAVNNMIQAGLEGVEFVVANTDAQALAMSSADSRIQMGTAVTEGLGAGSQPQIGAAAAEEAMAEILDHTTGAHMVFITAGMGGGTGTGAAPVIAQLARAQNILTIGGVTKPFQFEGARRMEIAEAGISELAKHVDTLIIIPNQNLFRVANERTTFADAFAMADQVLYSGVAGITDLMIKEGLINLDFADVRTIMTGMGKAMMGTGEASGEQRAIEAAEAAIANPLLDDVSMKGARGLLISITGGEDLTLYEVDEAATRIRSEVDPEANIILGATFDNALEGYIRVSVVATGIEGVEQVQPLPQHEEIDEYAAPEIATGGDLAPAQQHVGLRPAVEDGFAAQPAPMAEFTQPAEPIDYPAAEPAPYPGEAAESADVTVRRVEGRAGIGLRAPLPEPAVAPAQAEAEAVDPNRPFIPPRPQQAERRMPRVDEFPTLAQRTMAAGGEAPAYHGIEEQKRKTGFLERLANVGLGRRSDETEEVNSAEPRFDDSQQAPELAPGDGGNHPLRRAEQPVAPARPAEPARKHDLAAMPAEDDELEIPAFLRRQAN